MTPAWIRKIGVCLGTILLAMTFTFVLIRQMPGDVLHTWAVQIQMDEGISYEEALHVASSMMNYDPTVPIPVQYVRYVKGLLLHGELGYSMTYRIPVTTILLQALPWTLFITSSAVLLSFGIGIGIGNYLAWKRRSMLDPIVVFGATVTQAVPDFIVGLLLIIVLGVSLRWLPLRGAYGPDVAAGFNLPFILDVLYHAILPIAAFALPATGGWILAMRACATSVLGEDYIQVARAKGLTPERIRRDYLARNAILPLVTNLATTLGAMLGGSMLVETLFGYPGLGYFLQAAIATRDYTLMQGLFLLTTVAVVVANLLGDMVATQLDPRIRV